MVGATALVAAPISSSPPDIQVPAIHAATVELAAVTNPIDQLLELFGATFTNVVGIGGAVVADPAPFLRQVILNQLGYAQTTVGGLGATTSGLLAFVTQTVPPALRQAVAQIAQGDVVGAAQTITNLELPLLLTLQPLLELLAIPGQITDNLSNVVKTLTSPDAVLGLITGTLAPVQAVISAAGFSGQQVVDALGSGDPIGALTAIINVPAVLTGALLNGFADGSGTFFPGILTFDPVPINGGIVQTLLVTLPHLLAQAITPAPAPINVLAKAGISAVPDLTATTLRLDTSSKDSGVQTLGVDADPVSGTTPDTDVDPGTVDPGTVDPGTVDPGTVDPGTEGADDGQVTTTDPDTSTATANTKDGNKVVPGEVKTGATGQGTPKSPVKAFGDQVKSFLGKLGFKPHTGKKTSTTESGTPAADADGSASAGAGANGAGTGGTGGTTSGGGE
jgi:hypothetical protein